MYPIVKFTGAVLIILCISAKPVQAQTDTLYFYRPDITFGSEGNYSPLTTILNGSFDILRNGSRSKDISRINYGGSLSYVWENISHPVAKIKEYSPKEFFAAEIFPYKGIDLKNFAWSWAPNYFTHILGYGFEYAKMAEWFDHHGYKHPQMASMATSTFYQIMNEAIEHGVGNNLNTDCIADILIFNPIGIGLFSLSRTKKMFSEGAVKIYDWSSQPVLNPFTMYLENTGQNFALKISLGKKTRSSAFMYWGIHGLLGLSVKMKNNTSISLGGGVVINSLVENTSKKAMFIMPNLDGAIGVFYDKENSLMCSAIYTGPQLKNLRINIYPGIIKTRFGSPGVYVGFGQWDDFIAGVSLAQIPLGIAF